MQLQVGRTYLNGAGDKVHISQALKEGDLGYNFGFRYKDSKNNTYRDDGTWSLVSKKKTLKDLKEEQE